MVCEAGSSMIQGETTYSGAAAVVAQTLEEYARRGIFKGFAVGSVLRGRQRFRIVWHANRAFDIVLDLSKHELKVPVLLPSVPSKSTMQNDLGAFLARVCSTELPKHRRIDSTKVHLVQGRSRGDVSLTAVVLDEDFEYAARRLINLIHEIYLNFLTTGLYEEYRAKVLGVNWN
jgi:hypothetical protein